MNLNTILTPIDVISISNTAIATPYIVALEVDEMKLYVTYSTFQILTNTNDLVWSGLYTTGLSWLGWPSFKLGQPGIN